MQEAIEQACLAAAQKTREYIAGNTTGVWLCRVRSVFH
jgi:hypothetical protein